MGERALSKKEILSYLFFTLGIVAVGFFTAGIIPIGTLTILLGLFGFSGVAALRSYIVSHGWKTWGSVFLGFVGIILAAVGVFTPIMLGQWLAVWGLTASIGVVHAIRKAQ